jgi:transglutaminase-like putative cysteine protease
MENLEQLRTLPFAQQLRLIDGRLDRISDIAELLKSVAHLRDHEPLSYLVRELIRRNHLNPPSVIAALQSLFFDLPDTGIQRLLKGIERVTLTEQQSQILVDCAANAIRELPLKRLAATCLLDRWLKNTDGALRVALLEEAVAQCRDAINENTIESLDDRILSRVAGTAHGELRELSITQKVESIWVSRLKRFSDDVLGILEATPKSLSQANAESILSHQVYTDPGHFLIELLQNAEDAQASYWRVEISEDSVSAAHDGIPFDARDVVGVLSIGQTTKHKEQIGFFGVGFKSVYEICERPQVYSEPFCFEIADVSIPRKLERRPCQYPDNGTLLVLPLRDPHDPHRGPEQLFQRSLAVPPQTLLTLSHIKRLELHYGSKTRTIVRRPGNDAGRTTLAHLETEEIRHYLVESDEFSLLPPDPAKPPEPTTVQGENGIIQDEGVARGAHRAMRTPVLIAIALDARGCPQSFPPNEATIFSYLPTGERSGLRFLLHAHFDLPVDRERLDLSSAWNRWAISCAGQLLARIAQRLVTEAQDQGQALAYQRIDALLDILPLPEDLRHPNYHTLIDEMLPRLRNTPLLLAANRSRVAPNRAMIAEDPRVVDVLADIAVDAEGRRLIMPLDGRKRQMAEFLGVRAFGTSEIVELLAAQNLATPPPHWLRPALPTLLETLGMSATDTEVSRLADLPVLVDDNEELARPSDLVRIPRDLRWFYRGIRRTLREALDLAPSAGQGLLWERLAIVQLGFDNLIDDLENDESVRRGIATPEGVGRLLAYVRTVPDPQRLQASEIARWPLFPDVQGQPGPIVVQGLEGTSEECMWLTPPGPLGDYLRDLQNSGLRLLDANLQTEHRSLLLELGATVMDLPLFLAQIRNGSAILTDDELLALHPIFDAIRDDLSDRARQQLSLTSIFLDHEGTARPLRGDGCAWIPADAGLVSLSPDAPWLDPTLLERHPYIRALGVDEVGIRTLVDTLVSEESSPLVQPEEPSWLRRAYAYLAARAQEMPPRLASHLATAGFWLDTDGKRSALHGLRRMPSAPTLATLYRAWNAFSFVDEEPTEQAEASALSLCQALRLDGELVCPGYDVLIDDLRHGAPMDATNTLLRPLLVDALLEASQELSSAVFETLRHAPIFQSVSGELLPLEHWRSQGSNACRRANHPLRGPLSLTTTPLLSETDEREFFQLLERLRVPPAGVEELIRAIETDSRFKMIDAAALSRSALVELRPELEVIRDTNPLRLDSLRLWPTTTGDVVSSKSVFRQSTLAAVLGENWRALVNDGASILEPSVENEADELAAYFRFADPIALAIDRIENEAIPNAPLLQQPAFLASRENLLHLLKVIAGSSAEDLLGSLPLALNANEDLVVGPRYRATEDEFELSRPLPLFDSLADPSWARDAGAIDDRLAPALPVRRLILALREVSAETGSAANHPVLFDRDQRARLYRWLVLHAPDIKADEASRTSLERTAAIITTQGTLRAPCQLLFETDLPDLGIDWEPGKEVPESLVNWLSQTYRLEDRQLEQILKRLVEAHIDAVDSADGLRSRELLRFMAQSLGGVGEIAQRLKRLPRSLNLHHQLSVESMEGRFARPTQLFLPDAQDWGLLESFCEDVPLRVARQYIQDPSVVQLLESLGAKRALGTGRLKALLSGTGRRAGLPAGLAFAQYLAKQLTGKPSLRDDLRLDRIAWIPNGHGEFRPPGELYPPISNVFAVLGDQPEVFPHPEFIHGLTEDAIAPLPFRPLKSAKLSAITKRIVGGGEAPPEVLAWLEAAIEDRRVEVAEVNQKLWAEPFIVDDRGDLRAPAQLMRNPPADLYGHRRSTWSNARDYPRLADALKLLRTSGTREVLCFLEEVAGDLAEFERQELTGDSLLEAEPELAHCLPRSLVVLARGKARPPASLPLIVSGGSAHTTLIAINEGAEATVALPEPPELAFAIEAHRLSSPDFDGPLFPLIVDEDRDVVINYLTEKVGLQTLGQIWKEEQLPIQFLADCTREYAGRAQDLGSALTELMCVLPRLRETLRHIAPDAWCRNLAGLQIPWRVTVVNSLRRSGQLGNGMRLEVEREIASEPGRLVLKTAVVADADAIADHLCRAVILDGRSDDQLFETVRDLLGNATGGQMHAHLDALGFRKPADPTFDSGRRERKAAAKDAAKQAKAAAKRANASTSANWESTESATESELRPPASTEGLVARLRKWWKGSAEERPKDRPVPRNKRATTPPPAQHREKDTVSRSSAPAAGSQHQPPRKAASNSAEHASWFQPDIAVGPQLDPRDRPSKRERPDFGLSFAPYPLPGPFLYGPKQIMNHFDPSNQRWSSVGLRSEWCNAATCEENEESGDIVFRGRLPAGQATLPLPLFSELCQLETGKETRILASRTGQTLLTGKAATEVNYRAKLGPLPNFNDTTDSETAPTLLFDRTAPDEDLPNEAHDFLADLHIEALPTLNRCITIQDFIRQNYSYDPGYLEDPHIARWLRSVSRGRMNSHLAALHAGRDARSLGRGVCYELNILACELLRRAGVPAGIATGWTFDRGNIAEPDHLWAMALINTEQGLRWYPIDASTTREGRPLHFGDRPAGPWRVKAPRKRKLPKVPIPRGKALPRPQPQKRIPAADLMRVAQHLEALSGEAFADKASLERRCHQLLSDPDEARALIEVLLDIDA